MRIAIEQCIICREEYPVTGEADRTKAQEDFIQLLQASKHQHICPECLDKTLNGFEHPEGSAPIVALCIEYGVLNEVKRTQCQQPLSKTQCLIVDEYYWDSDNPNDRMHYLRCLAAMRSLMLEDIPVLPSMNNTTDRLD